MDDHAAVRLCQDGQSDAFRLIVERHSGVLYGTAFLMTRNQARAEEMVQEALLLAWRGIRSFKPNKSGTGSGLRSWLIRILVNRVISEGRRNRVEETEIGPSTPEPSVEPEGEAQVLRAEERELMGEAMSILPDEQRRALTLRYYADLTIPEIARVLGWAEGTVKSRIHRGLRRLEEALGPPPPRAQPNLGAPAPANTPTTTSDAAPSMRDEQ
jgi:RNA polymerase sigma-70 factor (ECF subfamily)